MPRLDWLPDRLLTIFNLLRDALRFIRLCLRPGGCSGRRQLEPPQTVGSVSGAPRLALSSPGGGQVDPGVACQTLSGATGSDHPQARHFHPVASASLSVVLKVAMEPPGRSRLPDELPTRMVARADHNPPWGEECLAAERLLKGGFRSRRGPSDAIGALTQDPEAAPPLNVGGRRFAILLKAFGPPTPSSP